MHIVLVAASEAQRISILPKEEPGIESPTIATGRRPTPPAEAQTPLFIFFISSKLSVKPVKCSSLLSLKMSIRQHEHTPIDRNFKNYLLLFLQNKSEPLRRARIWWCSVVSAIRAS